MPNAIARQEGGTLELEFYVGKNPKGVWTAWEMEYDHDVPFNLVEHEDSAKAKYATLQELLSKTDRDSASFGTWVFADDRQWFFFNRHVAVFACRCAGGSYAYISYSLDRIRKGDLVVPDMSGACSARNYSDLHKQVQAHLA